MIPDHFLSTTSLTLEKLQHLFKTASHLEALRAEENLPALFKGKILANLFFEPSTRTRISFEVAFKLLGGDVFNVLDAASSSLSKGESFYDMSRVMSGYADVMVMRHPSQAAIHEIAQASSVPVINAGNGTGEHPSQALIDLYTMFKEVCQGQFEKLNRLKICLVGDLKHGRTVHSLVKLLRFFPDVELRLVSPSMLSLPEDLLTPSLKMFATADLAEGVRDADVIYMTRIQEERFESAEEFSSCAGAYSIDHHFFETACAPHAILMHPMPRNSRLAHPEIASDLNAHPRLAMFRQSANGVPVRMALFADLLGKAL